MKIPRTIILILSCIVVVVASAFLFQDNLSRVWAASRPQQQSFVELAFESPATLPAAIKSGQPYSFGFWAKPTTLSGPTPYEVVVENSKGREIVAHGTLQLEVGKRTNYAMTLVSPEVDARQRVIVHLPELHQSIQFWVAGDAE